MWNWLQGFRPRTRKSTVPAHWRAPHENPWGLTVLDCTENACSMMSFTENPEIAKKYAILRASTGEQVRNEIFDPSLTTGCNLTYDIVKHPPDGPVFKSEAMEEKWDIYLYDEHLYFCQSWGGELIYRAAAVKCEPPVLTVSEVAASHKDYEKNAVRNVDFLIKSHLLSAKALHYLPSEMGRNTKKLALFSFTLYGRLGRYGTFEETIGTLYYSD